ncbi:MAG: SMR family transporter [Paracoccaceae bacterium]|nr:SMR family transporter [Paracoccaceae bacterium]MDG1739638.1 SMR family transporter [Paracoccaceae bacterium]MDG2260423.1 SMR family transporter [Paracoccaceae bacterium]
MPVAYFYLVVAVILETIGTSALQASAQFSKLWPSVIVVIAYGAAFFFLALCLKYIPVGIAYALWSGLGIVFISVIGVLVFGQKLDFAAVAGMILILVGIGVIHLFSSASSH